MFEFLKILINCRIKMKFIEIKTISTHLPEYQALYERSDDVVSVEEAKHGKQNIDKFNE